MKNTKKIVALLVVAVMVLAMSVSVFADTPKGKITIENSVAGDTYNVFKVFDATIAADGKSFAYSLKEGQTLTEAAKTYFEADAQGNVKFKTTATELNDDAIAAIATLVNTEQEPDYKITATGVDASVNVDYGYYYIVNADSGKGTVATVTTAKDVTIIEKNERVPVFNPDNFKTVKYGSGYGDVSHYSIGDTADFKITFDAVNFVVEKDESTGKTTSTKVVNYVIKDTATNLKVNESTVKISVGGDELKNTAYTYDNGTITIAWVDSSSAHIYEEGATVVITYSAEIMDTTASNSAMIYYNGDTAITEEDDEPNTENTTGTLTVKSYCNTTALEDAVYSIVDNNGKSVNLVKISDGKYKVANSEDVTTTTKIENNGSAFPVIEGLGFGNYVLVVEHTPEGYNKLSANDDGLRVTINAEVNTATVYYTTGNLLPETGSTGIAMFIGVGSTMIVVAGLFLVANKRMSKEFN